MQNSGTKGSTNETAEAFVFEIVAIAVGVPLGQAFYDVGKWFWKRQAKKRRKFSVVL